MSVSRSRRFRPIVVMLLLMSACSSGLESGVNVKSVTTDLVYGIPEVVVPAAPANSGRPPDQPVRVVHNTDQGGEDDFEPPAAPPPPECATAPLDKFPDPALSTVKGRPKVGEYMWRVDGTEDTALLGKIPLKRSTRKQITGVLDTDGDAFQFAVTEEDLRFGARSKVKTLYEVVPGDGIFITRIERETEGGAKSLFQPVPSVEILPLPAAIGVEIDATGIDPTTLEVLRMQGTVPSRKRIDACGDPVDSFLVDGVQSFISASGEITRRRYDYGVATSLGGQIVYESVEAPCNADAEDGTCDPKPTLVFESHLGQIEPDEIE